MRFSSYKPDVISPFSYEQHHEIVHNLARCILVLETMISIT
jgi:hypothetical protein